MHKSVVAGTSCEYRRRAVDRCCTARRRDARLLDWLKLVVIRPGDARRHMHTRSYIAPPPPSGHLDEGETPSVACVPVRSRLLISAYFAVKQTRAQRRHLSVCLSVQRYPISIRTWHFGRFPDFAHLFWQVQHVGKVECGASLELY